MIVFWDTNLFIYLFEPNGAFGEAVEGLERRMRERGDRLVTSALTLGELLVHARSEFDEREADRLRLGLSRVATIVPFDELAADHYASIRSRTAIKGPDAVQLACAAAGGTDLFVTNDDRLSRRIVPGVGILSSLLGVPI